VDWYSLHGVVDGVHVDEVTHAHLAAVDRAMHALQLTTPLLHLHVTDDRHTYTTVYRPFFRDHPGEPVPER